GTAAQMLVRPLPGAQAKSGNGGAGNHDHGDTRVTGPSLWSQRTVGRHWGVIRPPRLGGRAGEAERAGGKIAPGHMRMRVMVANGGNFVSLEEIMTKLMLVIAIPWLPFSAMAG